METGNLNLNRDLSRYAKDRSERALEELIAELGSCFLCADLGIAPELDPRPDHASYLASWLKVLADDKRTIFSAAAHAQRAVAFLHGLQPLPLKNGWLPDVPCTHHELGSDAPSQIRLRALARKACVAAASPPPDGGA